MCASVHVAALALTLVLLATLSGTAEPHGLERKALRALDALLATTSEEQHRAALLHHEFDVYTMGLSEPKDLDDIGIPLADGARLVAAARRGAGGVARGWSGSH